MSTKSSEDLAAEIANLKAWKDSAIALFAEWDKVHAALGSPGKLGQSMAQASLAEIERLRGTTNYEQVPKQALDDALALIRELVESLTALKREYDYQVEIGNAMPFRIEADRANTALAKAKAHLTPKEG